MDSSLIFDASEFLSTNSFWREQPKIAKKYPKMLSPTLYNVMFSKFRSWRRINKLRGFFETVLRAVLINSLILN